MMTMSSFLGAYNSAFLYTHRGIPVPPIRTPKSKQRRTKNEYRSIKCENSDRCIESVHAVSEVWEELLSQRHSNTVPQSHNHHKPFHVSCKRAFILFLPYNLISTIVIWPITTSHLDYFIRLNYGHAPSLLHVAVRITFQTLSFPFP